MVEEIIYDIELSSTPDEQTPSPIEFPIVDEGLEVDNHRRVVQFPSQEDLLPKSIHAHQHDDLHTYFCSHNQNILSMLEDKIAIYDESTISYDHEEEVEFLSWKSPKNSQVEDGVVLNEAYI